MAMNNMTAAQQALKNYYLDGMVYQLNTSNPILAVMEKDNTNVSGDTIIMALRYGRQGGFGMRADDGDLPTPQARKTKQASWKTKNIFHRIQITDKTMRASRSSQGAFVSLLEADLEDAMADAKDHMARMCFGDGSGKLATCTAQTGVNTLTVDSVQYLVEGYIVDIVDNVGNVKASARNVTAVDDVAKTVTIDGAAVTTVATDIITISGNYNQELTGFGAVFTQNNTLYNVDRSQNKWFNAQTTALGGEISEVGIQQQIDNADRKAGSTTNFFVASYGVRRAYQNLLQATKRTTDVMNLKGGFQVLTYNNLPFTVDKYAPAGTLIGLDLSTWKCYEIMDFQWLDDDGAVLSRVSGKAAWEATLAKYCDFGCSKPRGNWQLTGVTEH